MARRKLLIFLLPISLMAQVPTQFPSGTIQNSDEISMYSSSLDNLVNSQQGEFIAITISQDLAQQASQSYQGCDDPQAAQDPDCLMSGTLLGMKELTDQSAASFNGQARVAQSNVCVFASQICDVNIPNPYSSLSPRPPLSQAELDQLVENLDRRGIQIQPRTGVVSVSGVSVINPSSTDSLKKKLGESKTNQLMATLKSLEKRAVQLAAKLSKSQVLKKMGLKEILPGMTLGQKSYQKDSAQPVAFASNNKQINPVYEGMVTSYQGEPVGIGKDSLFRIVKKRYQIKINQRTFLGPR